MRTAGLPHVAVIGAGVGGLVAAIEAALAGARVTLLEQSATPGGKMRQSICADQAIDAGPTVLTMRWVFDDLFRRAGASLDERIVLRPLEVLARHVWQGSSVLDLYADQQRSYEAISALAGQREADGFARFCKRSAAMFHTLEQPFLYTPCSSPIELMRSIGIRGLPGLAAIAPFTSMHQALREYFRDERLLQLFGRYATYCGSSPYLAPATLMLVAHVEQLGVWSVTGGMYQLALALAQLADQLGVLIHYNHRVEDIEVHGGQVIGVAATGASYLAADAVIVNADCEALAAGLFGQAAASVVATRPERSRSLSAVTWAINARCEGMTLSRHNVFFSSNYALEFEQLFQRGMLPSAPTVYVCAQDRLDNEAIDHLAHERLLCLINAPARDGSNLATTQELDRCQHRTMTFLESCGLKLTALQSERTDPGVFAQRYPATSGALYGQASHGWKASFQRPSARTKIAGLYLAGGSTHPGPGVPMAALSGRLAARALCEDLNLTGSSPTTATPGGMSMR